ncbi:hypothetical protein GGI12_002587 [Dipsacomyces acuminosporus]|nr:hypothetical protein GGI12_002587 [Dipsacomyces acuminosporus]
MQSVDAIKIPSAEHKPPFSRVEVQFADPELKREALSELFDHCMAPISTLPQPTRCTSNPGIKGYRARPQSAAPLFELELSPSFLASASEAEPPSAVISPIAPHDEAGLYFDARYSQYQPQQHYQQEPCAAPSGAEATDYLQDGEEAYEEHAAIGIFANLRKKLYGGNLHSEASSSVSSLHRD